MKLIRIILADNHHIVREGIRILLETEGSFQIMGEASDGVETIELVEKHMPDIVLLNMQLSVLSGFDILKKIRASSLNTNVILMAPKVERSHAIEVLRSGAHGYITKEKGISTLIQTIKQVHAGTYCFSPEITNEIVNIAQEYIKNNGNKEVLGLTPREIMVLKLISKGHTTKEIAVTMSISPKTVQTHRNNLKQKLNARHVTDLVRIATQSGKFGI